MKIKLYTTNSCPWCSKLKEYLTDNKVEFEEINVTESVDKQQKLIEITGRLTVPVVFFDDSYVIGFDKPKIDEFLKSKN